MLELRKSKFKNVYLCFDESDVFIQDFWFPNHDTLVSTTNVNLVAICMAYAYTYDNDYLLYFLIAILYLNVPFVAAAVTL